MVYYYDATMYYIDSPINDELMKAYYRYYRYAFQW